MLAALSTRLTKGENCPVFSSTVESSHSKFNCVYIAMVEFDSDDDKIAWILYEWPGSISFAPSKVVLRFREIFARSFVWSAVIQIENKLNISMRYVRKTSLDKKKTASLGCGVGFGWSK